MPYQGRHTTRETGPRGAPITGIRNPFRPDLGSVGALSHSPRSCAHGVCARLAEVSWLRSELCVSHAGRKQLCEERELRGG